MQHQNQERVRRVNVMNATYSNGMRTYARVEAKSLATPPYKAYNQLVSYVNEANIPYMGVTTGHRMCRVSNALFVYINFINYN